MCGTRSSSTFWPWQWEDVLASTLNPLYVAGTRSFPLYAHMLAVHEKKTHAKEAELLV